MPFIIGCVYLWLWWLAIPFAWHSVVLVVASLITTAGFASLGYLINELFDIKDDLKAGKTNKLALMPRVYTVLLFVVSLLFTFLPWLYLPVNSISVVLIVLELSAFVLYSLPFPRLKKVPLVSNLLDAGYAYLFPLLLSFHTFRIYTGTYTAHDYLLLGFMSLLVLLIGLRNILIHQVDDVFSDKLSGIVTLPMWLGVRSTNYFMLSLLLLELLLLSAWLCWMCVLHPVFLFVFVVYSLAVLVKYYLLKKNINLSYFSITPIRHLTDLAHQIFFPLATLLLLILANFKWALILPVHLMVLIPAYVMLLLWGYMRLVFYFIRHNFQEYIIYPSTLVVNYSIYYCFLFFKVDLKKENRTAWQVISKLLKWNR